MAKILKITTLAEELKSIKADIAEIEGGALADLKAKEAQVRDSILAELKVTGLGNIKLESGEVFTRAYKVSFNVTDIALATPWAQERGLITTKLDTAKINKVLKRELSVPDGFERVDTEYLAVRGATSNEDEE